MKENNNNNNNKKKEMNVLKNVNQLLYPWLAQWFHGTQKIKEKMYGYFRGKQWRLKFKYKTENRISFGRKYNYQKQEQNIAQK